MAVNIKVLKVLMEGELRIGKEVTVIVTQSKRYLKEKKIDLLVLEIKKQKIIHFYRKEIYERSRKNSPQ